MASSDIRGRNPRLQAALIVGVGVVCAMHVGKLPVAIPSLRNDLGLTLVEAGFLLSVVQVAGMLGGLAIGLLADRLGPQRVMQVGLCLLAAGSAAGAVASHVTQLMWSRGLEGAGFLLAVLPAPALLRRSLADPVIVSRSLGWWGAYMPLGTAMALLLGGAVIGVTGWRGLWMALSFMSLCSAWALWRHVPASGGAGVTEGFGARLKRTLRAAGPWLTALAFFLYSGQWLAVVGFLPTVYADAGVSTVTAGWLTALAAGINMTGNIAAGRLLARGCSPGLLLGAGYGSMALGAMGAFGLEGCPAIQYIGVLLFSALGGLIPGTLFALSVQLAPSEQTVSTSVGWMQQWSSLGQFAGPPAVAALAVSAGGWQNTWWITGMCSVLGLLLASALQRLWLASVKDRAFTRP